MSIIDNLPGYKEAITLGYSLHSYSGNYQGATYTAPRGYKFIWLTVTIDPHAREGQAGLKAIISYYGHGLVTITTGEFSFPHKLFRSFERDVTRYLDYDLEYPMEDHDA